MPDFLRPVCAAIYQLVALLLLTVLSARAQAPAWQSVLTAPGGSGDVQAMALDGAGNVYLAGVFYGRITFGNTTLIDAGYGDAFVAKWNPTTNTFVWAKRAGGTEYDCAEGIAVSGSTIYLTGAFESPLAEFGPTTIANAQPATVPFYLRSDGFVARLTDTGPDASFGWAQQFGGLGFDMASAVVATGSTVYLAGRYGAPSATFGSFTLGNASSGSQLNTDFFVAKLTDTGSAGSFVWVQRGGGYSADYAATLALSGTSLYVGGAFQNYAYLSNNLTLEAPGCTSGFVAKLTDNGASGSFRWARVLGGSQYFNSSTAVAVAVNAATVYVAGQFDGAGSFGSFTLVSAGQSDLFVAKLTDAGSSNTLDWAQRGGGASFDGASGLAVASTGGIYVTGSFVSPKATFGSTILTNFNPGNTASSGSPDAYLSKLTDAGSFVWTLQAGGTSTDFGAALATRGSTLYLAGGASVPASFGPLQLSGPIPYRQPYIAALSTNLLATGAASPALAGRLYPNPARTTTNVPLPAAPGGSQGQLLLLNAMGQLVRNQVVALAQAPSTCPLDLTGLPRGLYTLLVQVGSRTTSEKLVVE